MKCNTCKHTHKGLDESPCLGCIHNSVDNYSRMTNFEYIQSLSIDQFVDWLLTEWENLKYAFTDTELGVSEWLTKSCDMTESEIKEWVTTLP